MADDFDTFCNNHREFIDNAIKDFMGIYYYSHVWEFTYWRGFKAFKYPTDLWTMQEIIHETSPEVIIETGVMHGGSTLFFADMMEMRKQGKVIAIENNMRPGIPQHGRIDYIIGDCLSKDVLSKVRDEIHGGKKVMVVLDSDHHKAHVLKEMEIYSKFVTPGNYLIVEDTCISGHPITVKVDDVEIKPGPFEAVMEFMEGNRDFDIDRRREKFFLTTNPMGYLRKKKGEKTYV